MKYIIIFLLTIFTLSIVSCKKDKFEYEVECIAKHRWTDQNEWGIGMGSGYYGFTISNEDYIEIWNKSGNVQDETLTFKTTAKSGDYIFVYVSVYDTYDYCSAQVKVDGESVVFISEDNQFLDESTSYDFRTINGKEYIVKEIKLP